MMLAALLVTVAGTFVAAAIDARTGYVPNVVSRGTAIAAFALAAIGGTAGGALAGAVLAGGSLLALYLLTAGRGIGLGDVKLAVAIGAGCGPLAATVAVGLAFVLGGTYASALLATRRARRGTAIPFAPFLAAGTLGASVAAVMAR